MGRAVVAYVDTARLLIVGTGSSSSVMPHRVVDSALLFKTVLHSDNMLYLYQVLLDDANNTQHTKRTVQAASSMPYNTHDITRPVR